MRNQGRTTSMLAESKLVISLADLVVDHEQTRILYQLNEGAISGHYRQHVRRHRRC